ncbi:MAG: GNAT family N-acetyltransferase [Lentilitoribacter sp.]
MTPKYEKASNNGLRLREAADPDRRFVLWVEEVCMKEYAIALWGKWLRSTTVKTVDIAGHQIIELNSQAIGCVATTRFENYVQIDKLYITPDFQNRGFGADVLRQIHDARPDDLPLRLSVLTTNPALKFYLREGFSVEKEDPERYTLLKK